MNKIINKTFVMFAVLGLCSHKVIASNGNSGSSSSSNSQSSRYETPYTAADLEAFVSTFSAIPAYPSDYSWDNVPAPMTSSKPIVASFPQTPVIPVVTSGLVSDGTLDMASLADLGYEGVKCAAGTYKFPLVINDSNNIPQNKVIEILLPQAPQKNSNESNSQSEQIVACKDRLTAAAGKVINGNIVFQCQAGLWRIKQVGCRDTETACYGGSSSVNVTTSGNGSFANTVFNVTAGKYLDGSAAGVYSCKAVLPAPSQSNLSWAGNINLSCNGGSFSVASNDCNVIDATSNVYPNCGSGIIGSFINKGQVVGRACFPKGTTMLGYYQNPDTYSTGPNVFTWWTNANPFYWVKRDVVNSMAPVNEYLGCGKYISTPDSVCTSTTCPPLIAPNTLGTGSYGEAGSAVGLTLYNSTSGSTSYYSKRTFYVQSIPCP